MNQQVFKQSLMGAVVITIAIIGVIIFFLATADSFNPLLILILLIPGLFIVGIQKTKLIIEGDVLRYEKLSGSEEISLKQVSQIITREIDVISSSDISILSQKRRQDPMRNRQYEETRSTEKVIYVLDSSGRTFFSFPAGLVTRKDRQRFADAITAINPNIEVF